MDRTLKCVSELDFTTLHKTFITLITKPNGTNVTATIEIFSNPIVSGRLCPPPRPIPIGELSINETNLVFVNDLSRSSLSV